MPKVNFSEATNLILSSFRKSKQNLYEAKENFEVHLGNHNRKGEVLMGLCKQQSEYINELEKKLDKKTSKKGSKNVKRDSNN